MLSGEFHAIELREVFLCYHCTIVSLCLAERTACLLTRQQLLHLLCAVFLKNSIDSIAVGCKELSLCTANADTMLILELHQHLTWHEVILSKAGIHFIHFILVVVADDLRECRHGNCP